MAFLDLLRSLNPFGRKKETRREVGGIIPPIRPVAVGGLRNEDWLLSGTWLHVASSNVEAARYLWDARLLEVEFKSKKKADGSVTPSSFYQYFDVPPSVADGMSTTDSPGRYVWSALRDKFPYVALQGLAGKTSPKPTVVRQRNDLKGRAPFADKPKWMR